MIDRGDGATVQPHLSLSLFRDDQDDYLRLLFLLSLSLQVPPIISSSHCGRVCSCGIRRCRPKDSVIQHYP